MLRRTGDGGGEIEYRVVPYMTYEDPAGRTKHNSEEHVSKMLCYRTPRFDGWNSCLIFGK
jgi:hypothetical protein